jgi:hypothetical protein
MRVLLTRDATKDLLALHLPDLARSIREAVERYNRERAVFGPLHPRTRACHINEFASNNAAAIFDGRDGVVVVIKDDGTVNVIFDDLAIVRIKKLDHNLNISYQSTKRADRWAAQQPLDGFPMATNLVAGRAGPAGHLAGPRTLRPAPARAGDHPLCKANG